MTITPYAIPGFKTLTRQKEDLIACDVFGITLDELYSKSRERNIVDCRNLLIYYSHKVRRITSIETGKIYGKDHATVLSAAKVVSNLKETDNKFRLKFDEFIQRCNDENFKQSLQKTG